VTENRPGLVRRPARRPLAATRQEVTVPLFGDQAAIDDD
jgi:hypothetical protein